MRPFGPVDRGRRHVDASAAQGRLPDLAGGPQVRTVMGAACVDVPHHVAGARGRSPRHAVARPAVTPPPRHSSPMIADDVFVLFPILHGTRGAKDRERAVPLGLSRSAGPVGALPRGAARDVCDDRRPVLVSMNMPEDQGVRGARPLARRERSRSRSLALGQPEGARGVLAVVRERGVLHRGEDAIVGPAGALLGREAGAGAPGCRRRAPSCMRTTTRPATCWHGRRWRWR